MRVRCRAHGLNLRGARVLVTGASSGIGRALAVELAGAGASLVVVARRRELLEALSDEIESAGHLRPAAIDADLSVPGTADALGRSALDALDGVIDVVINNAGDALIGPLSVVGDSARARMVFEVNLWAPLALITAVVPAMTAAGSGTIVNVTSTTQSVPFPLLGYYAASKAALAEATQSLRLELAETPIRVLEVVPGSTNTAWRDVGVEQMPWKAGPPPELPPVSPQASAAAIVRALQRGATRVVYPRTSLLPVEVPAIGRLIARAGGRRIDTLAALNPLTQATARVGEAH